VAFFHLFASVDITFGCRENHLGFHLLDPKSGHFADFPRHADNSTF
jgi:hypothetical protein